MIIRGDTIAAMCMTLPVQYMSLEIETIALEKGVVLAKEMGLQQIMIETDALLWFKVWQQVTRMAA